MTPAMQEIIRRHENAVAAFNEKHPIGTIVRYWRGVRAGEPSGVGKTTTEAQMLAARTAVVWIEGCSGCTALSDVEVVTKHE